MASNRKKGKSLTKCFGDSLTTAGDHPAYCPGSLVIKSLQKVGTVSKLRNFITQTDFEMNTKS